MQSNQNVKKIIVEELTRSAIPGKASHLARFFKTAPGEYGEGDQFLGVTVPDQRKVARTFYKLIKLSDLEKLLQEPDHECRLTALFILRLRYEKAKTSEEEQQIVDLYLRNLSFVNNWDLVDSSAPYILGPYLYNQDRDLLYELRASGNLWKQRIAVLTTFYFIRQGDFKDCLRLAEKLLDHPHDLIHKAVGWMLREVGNRDLNTLLDFLKKHHRNMPRTMLRYAIEKINPELRQKILIGRQWD